MSHGMMTMQGKLKAAVLWCCVWMDEENVDKHLYINHF